MDDCTTIQFIDHCALNKVKVWMIVQVYIMLINVP